MGRLRAHEELQDLLGAYALDAVEPDEALAVEEHLRTCPRCRDELRNHREVVGLLAYAGHEAPAGLWDRIAEDIHGTAGAPQAGPGVPIAEAAAGAGAGVVAGAEAVRLPGGYRFRPRRGAGGDEAHALDRRPWRLAFLRRSAGDIGPATRRRSAALRASAVVAAAACVAVALLGVEVAHLEGRTNDLTNQVAALSNQPTMSVVRAALATPGAHRVALRPPGGGSASLDAVVLPGGAGYLYDSTLAPLPATETYQLWGVIGSQRISYGLIGGVPAQVVAFRVGAGVQALAVTQEVAGGVVVTSHPPVVVGAVS